MTGCERETCIFHRYAKRFGRVTWSCGEEQTTELLLLLQQLSMGGDAGDAWRENVSGVLSGSVAMATEVIQGREEGGLGASLALTHATHATH